MKLSEMMDLIKDSKVIKDVDVNLLGMATTVYSDEKVLSFLEDKKYSQSIIDNKNIVAIITNKEIINELDLPNNIGVAISENPKLDFFKLHNLLVKKNFYWEEFENEIYDNSIISESAIISKHSVKIGENCLIEPGVVILPGSVIGDNVTIRSGTQIGTSGFQFINNGENVLAVKTGGKVIIKDRVEIQHNCCIDRGVLGGNTIISNDVKIDNFAHIAHDCYIGERTFITAGVKLSGRVTIGKDCWLGVNAVISNGITIGNNSRISLGSVVTQNVDDNKTVTGNFAIEHKKFIEFIKTIS